MSSSLRPLAHLPFRSPGTSALGAPGAPAPRAPGIPSRRSGARRVVGLALIGAVAVVVAGCDKPTPSVGIQSGRTWVHTSATQYEFDGGKVAKRSPSVPSITVVPGGTVNVDVSHSIAKRGYYLSVGGQRITDTITSDHYRLPVANTNGQAQIVLFQAPKKGSTSASGSWVFNLKVAP